MKAIGNESALGEIATTAATLDTVDLRGGDAPPEPANRTGGPRFVERQELGRGGLGVVVEAFDVDLRRAVAIKRPLGATPAPGAAAALVKEAQVTAQLEHPNVPSVHALGVDEAGRPYFVMTRLRGRSLAELLREATASGQPLGAPRLLRIFLQVAYSVAFAHSRGVLHRDLKPGNVFVGAYGEVRLVDWGLAKVLDRPEPAGQGEPIGTDAAPGVTRPGSVFGTPGYASPEQLRDSSRVDERSDVYSLGATLYEMLSGRRPVRGDTTTALIDNTRAGRVVPLAQATPVPKRLSAIVHKALLADPAQRYPSVLEMIADVEGFLEGGRVRAFEEGTLRRLGRAYAGRSPRLARLRAFEIDLLCWGSFFGGLATGMWLGPGLAGRDLWCALAGGLGLGLCLPGLVTLLRKPRPDDPGVVIPYSDLARASLPRSAPSPTLK